MASSEESARKKEERAKALFEEAARIREQIEAKRQAQENRALDKQQKAWGRRPQDTHRKILVGVAALSILKELPPGEKNVFAGRILGKLDERDRATLMQSPEFQSFKS